MSAKIPLLIGWTRTEETLYDRPTTETLALDEASLRVRLKNVQRLCTGRQDERCVGRLRAHRQSQCARCAPLARLLHTATRCSSITNCALSRTPTRDRATDIPRIVPDACLVIRNNDVCARGTVRVRLLQMQRA
jgi:hypothetical protein